MSSTFLPLYKQGLLVISNIDVVAPEARLLSVWNLAGRVLRIIATITVGPGEVLNEIPNVIFGGPGDVGPQGESTVTIGATEIDEGDETFEFLFTGKGTTFGGTGRFRSQRKGTSNG
jgi:hypothetical protein